MNFKNSIFYSKEHKELSSGGLSVIVCTFVVAAIFCLLAMLVFGFTGYSNLKLLGVSALTVISAIVIFLRAIRQPKAMQQKEEQEVK